MKYTVVIEISIKFSQKYFFQFLSLVFPAVKLVNIHNFKYSYDQSTQLIDLTPF